MCGGEAVVNYAHSIFYAIKTLNQFQYMDYKGQDHGVNVRQKSHDIVDLLGDRARLAEARRTRTLPTRRISKVEPLKLGPKRNLSDATNNSWSSIQSSTEERPKASEKEKVKTLIDGRVGTLIEGLETPSKTSDIASMSAVEFEQFLSVETDPFADQI